MLILPFTTMLWKRLPAMKKIFFSLQATFLIISSYYILYYIYQKKSNNIEWR